ncbi:MAG: radical SAM protein [Patescibacteria group bacterium]
MNTSLASRKLTNGKKEQAMLENTVTTFIHSKNGKKLSSRRVLFYLPERLVGYDHSSKGIIQTILKPVSVALCPTPFCVRKCIFCSNTQRNKENRERGAHLQPDRFVQLIQDLIAMGVQGVSVAGGGEPLAYDGPIVERLFLGQNLPFRIGIHTNGVLLDRMLIERVFTSGSIMYINVSVVAHCSELYTRICQVPGEQFFRIESNILKALRLKQATDSNLTLGVKILLCRENFSHVLGIVDYFKHLGVDNILVRCVGNFEPGQDVELLPDQIEQLSTIFKNDLEMNNDQIAAVTGCNLEVETLPIPSRCWICALQYTAGVDPDGEVYLCSPWSRKGYSVGNVNEKHLREIWGSDKHREVAQRLNSKLKSGECNPLLCRHYYSNLAIDAFIAGLIPALPKADIEKGYGRFI